MVQHIVLWNFVSTLTEEEKQQAANKMKCLLEPIGKKIKGVVSLEVITDGLSTSNKDIALISLFDSVDALNSYQIHDEHIEAGKYIKTVTCDRACIDYLKS